MRLRLPILIVSLFFLSCNKKLNVKETDALVKVGNKTLYRDTVEDNIPAGLSEEDSVITAEHFIRTWIDEILLYDIALKNCNDKENIDQLVENYRKSLLIYQYEEQLVNEKLSKTIDEQSIYDYYNRNKEKFKLERSLIKGIFLKVPANAPQVNEIRTWYKSTSSASREKLEKYRLNNIVIYDYFVDRWVDFENLANHWRVNSMDKTDFTVQKKTMEKQDDHYFYFLNITDCLQAGSNAPYEFIKPTIREILFNQQKIDFLKKTKEELFQRGLNKGNIHFYNE